MRIVRQIAHVRQRVYSWLHPTRLPTHEILNFASFALQYFIFVTLPVALRQRFPMTMILQLGCFSASLSIPYNLCSWAIIALPFGCQRNRWMRRIQLLLPSSENPAAVRDRR